MKQLYLCDAISNNPNYKTEKSPLPLIAVPITIADYFCNTPPNKINGQDIYYMREDGSPTENIIFYAENKNGKMSFFELIDMKGGLKIAGKNVYRRFIITPVFPFAEIKAKNK